MEDINKTTYFYRVKFKSKEAKFNVPSRLPDYFASMIGGSTKVVIAELGAGPINTIGNSWPQTEVEIHASDVLQPEYQKFWEKSEKTPIVPVVYQDFEKLSYPDGMFDIVHCVNALDHTTDARKALSEIKRVCKPGGWIYLRHSPNQMKRYGGMHQWNIYMEDGHKCVFESKTDKFTLGDEFHVRPFEGNPELIEAICQTSR